MYRLAEQLHDLRTDGLDRAGSERDEHGAGSWIVDARARHRRDGGVVAHLASSGSAGGHRQRLTGDAWNRLLSCRKDVGDPDHVGRGERPPELTPEVTRARVQVR